MNCKDADKYIHLYKEDELTSDEIRNLKDHLANCSECENRAKEIEHLKHITSELKKVNAPQVDTNAFANAIIKQIDMHNAHKVRLIQHTFFRIAAVLLITLSTIPLLIQNMNINRAVHAMETKFNSKQNNAFLNTYNDCVSQSGIMMAQIAKADEEVASLLANAARGSLPSELERYAGKICQSTFDIEQLNTKEKKELILQILRSKRSI